MTVEYGQYALFKNKSMNVSGDLFIQFTYQDRFREGVHQLMGARGLKSLQEVATILEIKYMALYKVMDGSNNPTTDLCIRLCKEAKLNANWLFLDEGPMMMRDHYGLHELQKEISVMRRMLVKRIPIPKKKKE
jgi:hypothetical protein